MYNNPYFNRPNVDTIDAQIKELERLRNQVMQNNSMQQPSINQTFQLTPNQNGIKYVNSIDDVNKEMVFTDTPFFSKDMSVLWVKNNKGEVKSYEINEIIQKDETLKSLKYMLESMQDFVKMLKSEAGSQEEMQLIREYTKKISEM